MADGEIDIGCGGNLKLGPAELGVRLEQGDLAGRRGHWLGNEMTLTDNESAVEALQREGDVFAGMSSTERGRPWIVARRQ